MTRLNDVFKRNCPLNSFSVVSNFLLTTNKLTFVTEVANNYKVACSLASYSFKVACPTLLVFVVPVHEVSLFTLAKGFI